jgi:DNA invertase Pin-like site-specific DNA recombinase
MTTKRTPKGKRAAVYVRISQDRGGEGLGVARQREACTKLARRLGWTVVDVFTDNDISAHSGKRRPGYEAMLAAVESGGVDAIVAWHPDRLTRRTRQLEDFIDVVEKFKVDVATCQAGTYDLTTATGRMAAKIVGATAQAESELKSERIKGQREQAAKDGRPQGGRRGYGYTSTMEIIPAEKRELRKIIERYLAGESLRQIAIDLNERGVKTVRGGPWNVTSLRVMVPSPRIAGLRVFRGEVVGKATWEPIIDEATHERLKARLGNPRQTRRGPKPKSLLTGVLRCGRSGCGALLRHNATSYTDKRNGQRYTRRRYMCEAGPARAGCGRLAVNADSIEAWVTDAVIEAVNARATHRRAGVVARARTNKELADANRVLADVVPRLKDLARMYAASELGKAEWLAARDALEARRVEAERIVAAHVATDPLAKYAKRGALEVAWPDLTTEEQRTIVVAVLPTLTVLPSSPGVRFSEDRLDPEWAI